MPTIFFRRLFVVCSVCMIVFCCGLAWLPRRNAEGHAKTVYFVVYPTESVEASTSEISLRGGAGYALTGEAVAFGVYFSQDEASGCKDRLCTQYPAVRVKACLFSLKEEGLTNTLYGILRVMDGWIKALENGTRQSVVKNGLAEVAGLVYRVGVESGKTVFCDFSKEILAISEGIVYASELRYLLCWMVDCQAVAV